MRNTIILRLATICVISFTLVSVFFSDLRIVEAQNTVYIRAAGNVEPVTAPITSVDNVTYVFAGDIHESVVIERSNIVVDVANHTVDGVGAGTGFSLSAVSNVTIKNANVRGFYYGVSFNAVSFSSILRSNVTNNSYDGILFSGSTENTLSGSRIANNGNDGIKLTSGSGYNVIFANNVTANNDDGIQVSQGSFNNITENFVAANNDLGVFLSNSTYNTFIGNWISNNRHGVELSSSPNNIVSGNRISSNSWNGLWLDASPNTVVSRNNVSNNFDGAYVYSCSNVMLVENRITENTEYGVWLDSSVGNNIQGNNITNNSAGIYLFRSRDQNRVQWNRIMNNDIGISLSGSTNNMVFLNNLTNNNEGATLTFSSSNNIFYHNNFINNVLQASSTSPCSWDNGIEGNYWSDYPVWLDGNSDGLGDASRVISTGNTDRFPLMGIFHSYTTPFGYVNVVSNSSVSDFQWSKSPGDIAIRVYVSNMSSSQALGFCRIAIPHALMTEPYNAIVNGTSPGYVNYALYDNVTYRWLYFSYNHSTIEVIVEGTDVTSPNITVLSPQNMSYGVVDVPLTFTVNELTSWIGYSLDGQANVTISGNAILSSLSDGVHNIFVYANDTAGNMGSSDLVSFTVDIVSPTINVVSPGNETYTESSVPLSFEINEATQWIGYSLDFQANVTTGGNTTLIGLSEGMHSVIVYANDTVGNTGQSGVVYFTIDTVPPPVAILWPENATYGTSDIPLIFTVGNGVSWKGYSLDGQMNVTVVGNTTLLGLLDGVHQVVVYANDTVGNMGQSDVVYFTVDTTSPVIVILSPENTTYATSDVPLTFTVSNNVSWLGYSLDGQMNTTVAGNVTLIGLSNGVHHILVYANDTNGNMGASDAVYFTIDTAPPIVSDVSQDPVEDNVTPDDIVTVNATIIDSISGVKHVLLNYTIDNSTWIPVDMVNIAGDVWSGTIPAFPFGTTVTYVVHAEDNVGNSVTTEELGYQYNYDVIPEFGSVAALLSVLILALLTLVVYKRKIGTK